MIRLRFMESKEMRERGASRKKAGSRPEKTGGESNFVVQGSILAIASIVVRIIGIAYRIPMINIIGDEGMGYYGTAFNVYNIALLLSSYSLPLEMCIRDRPGDPAQAQGMYLPEVYPYRRYREYRKDRPPRHLL